MARQLFISQETLTTWQDQDKVEFDGHVMTIRADGRHFTLLEAVRFIRLEGEGEDSAGLIGKVKTVEQIACMGAERYRDSVLLGEVAYKVQEGFIGEVFVRGGALDTGECAVAEPAARPAPDPGEARVAANESGEPPHEAARRSAAAVAQNGERGPDAAVLRLPVRRKEQDTARTQPALPVIPEPAMKGAALPAPDASAQPAASPPGDSKLSDEDLLTRFLLENL
jgi:hypothetical protein